MKAIPRDIAETSASMFIQQELYRHSHGVVVRGNNAVISCPFHAEHTPSCSVSLGGSVPPGIFHCWGCHEKGTWTALAKKLGASRLPVHTDGVGGVHSLNTSIVHERIGGMLDEHTDREEGYEWDELLPVLKGQPLFEPNASFRSIKRRFLRKFGCKRFLDPRSGEAFLIIPGNIYGCTQFLVMARLVRKNKRSPKYLSSKRGVGIIGLDEALRLRAWKKHKTILIVEGSRDVLALQQSGIPACAIMGTNTWDDRRIAILSSIDPRHLCLVFDNDDAGADSSRRIVGTYGHKLPLSNLMLPSEDVLGYKLDPADLSMSAHAHLYQMALRL